MIVSILSTAFVLWMAVEAVRRGDVWPWLWFIIFVPGIGALVYFFGVYLAVDRIRWKSSNRVTAKHQLQAEAEVRRLDNSAAWTRYASVLLARKRVGEAVEAGRKAVDKDPSSREARYELGRALLAGGRAAEAITPLESLVAEDPGFDMGAAQFALGQAHRAAGDLGSSRQVLEELARRSARPEFLFGLATVLLEAGDPGEAKRILGRIVDESQYVPKYAQKTVRPWVRKAKRALQQIGS